MVFAFAFAVTEKQNLEILERKEGEIGSR